MFSQGSPGQLTFNLTAKASPAKYGQAITWTMPQMDSATQIQLKPKNRIIAPDATTPRETTASAAI